MRSPLQVIFAGLFCVAVAVGGLVWIIKADGRPARRSRPVATRAARSTTAARAPAAAPRAAGPQIVLEHFEDGGVGTAAYFTGPIRDPRSLRELRAAVLDRGRLGLDVMRAKLDRLQLDADSPKEDVIAAFRLLKGIGLLEMYEGRFDEAARVFERARVLGRSAGGPPREMADLVALLGIAALRRGELDNCIACVGPSSCIFPISRAAIHQRPAGSRAAFDLFSGYLREAPGDLRVRWLLNLAAMTLGAYPEKVPAAQVVPRDGFGSKSDIGHFENVALAAGLTARGPGQAGGSIFDDFNGDGRPDLFTTSLDADRGASLWINRGDGTFEDHSAAAGLDDQVYALNVTRADIDNDGDLDLLLLRGAWEKPMRPSLLKNRGDGRFEDVTIAAGLADPISSESAAWGDFDDDGLVDVFLCGEYVPPGSDPATARPEPRCRCRLYRNQGDGTFRDVAAAAGVLNEQCGKGSAWGDFDGDGRLDLLVSNMGGPCRLYHNEGDGTFRDVAADLGVIGPDVSFACWFWDFDNDGRLDIYLNENLVTLAEWVAAALGVPGGRSSRPRLYRNLGPEGFVEVTHESGLDRPMTPMGCNFADVDNDGFLDLYLATGAMSFEYLVPNRMFRNVQGRSFEEVTTTAGTGHLQKGHGVSFADYDGDGDLDFFVEAGGGCPGDRSYNLLFQNPGHGRHWLDVKLNGTATNRAALGAHLQATIHGPDGTTRTIHRTIGNNSSFGGNTLVEHLGLGAADRVAELVVTWPTSRTTQTFRDLDADRGIAITEGTDTVQPLSWPPTTGARHPAASGADKID